MVLKSLGTGKVHPKRHIHQENAGLKYSWGFASKTAFRILAFKPPTEALQMLDWVNEIEMRTFTPHLLLLLI